MKKIEIIKKCKGTIKRNAYQARIHDELQGLNFEIGMQRHHRDTANGKAFAAMEILKAIDEKIDVDELYEDAVEEATQDILKSNYNIEELLNCAGFNGSEYLKYTI
ncbi:MAG: hypothetical protein LBS74_03035 [Oscillospiraceae bacterium]|jgi:hypothetical protein|nr:hypothetical protein [Oscillospiraceae bacterium]